MSRPLISRKLSASKRSSPVRIQGQLIIRNAERLQLGFGQMVQLDHRHLQHAEALGGEHTAVSDHHMAAVVDHHWHHKPKFPDAVGDLVDLTLRMLPWIVGIEDKIL
jgi:hypothetical protein